MPQIIAFDTHAYVKKLKAVGFNEEQAEVQAETLAELLENNLATKRDLKELEANLIIKMGKMMAFTAGIIIAAITALVKLL